MAIQKPHKDIIIEAWKSTYPGHTYTFHPIAASDTAGAGIPTTSDRTASDLKSDFVSTAICAPASYTMPANAEPVWDGAAAVRTASSTPILFALTCKTGQTDNLVFKQYVIIRDLDLASEKVIYISADFAATETIAPGSSYAGSTVITQR